MLHRICVIFALSVSLLVSPLARADGFTNAGVYTLAATGVTAAQSAVAQTAISNLDGADAVTLIAQFGYGSGGTSCDVLVQTTLDGGTTWLDVAHFSFTTASATKAANLSGLTAKAVGAYVALSGEGVNDGLLGNQIRAVITSIGTYVNTTLSVRASVR